MSNVQINEKLHPMFLEKTNFERDVLFNDYVNGTNGLFVCQWSTNSHDFGKQDSVIKEDFVKQKLEKNHNQDQRTKVRCCAMLLKLTSNVQINKNNFERDVLPPSSPP